MSEITRRLTSDDVLLLDGATGTELHRRGVATTLPLWSALGLIERPDVVRQIHTDYARAGADVIVANTFRTTRRTLARAGLAGDVVALNNLAVRLARDGAAGGRVGVLVAGSIAPLEDCYSPWLSPPFYQALTEHREQARLLAEAGVDFLMVETMPLATEAEAALIAARETGLDATVGFVCGDDGRLLSGETLAEAVARVTPHDPAAILVNCAPVRVIDAALEELRTLTALPIGGYANLGIADPEMGWAPDEAVSGDQYANMVAPWLRHGARVIGGCCGTTPEHISRLRDLLDANANGDG
ncbi:MAG: homocysteine S-methyltransferase family protein [Thermomicrobiales bacterium]